MSEMAIYRQSKVAHDRDNLKNCATFPIDWGFGVAED
jgi:hypothetical protein